MFFCMFFTVFYKTEKTCFYVFYLQINVFNIYGFNQSVSHSEFSKVAKVVQTTDRSAMFVMYYRIKIQYAATEN